MNNPTDPQFPYTTSLDTSASPFDADWAAIITDHPVGAILAAAALGAGAMALMSLGSASESPRKRAVDVADNEVESLKQQVSDLTRRLMADAPSPKAAKRQFSELGERALDAWNEVRDQASGMANEVAGRLRPQVAEMAGRIRPRVDAATDLAKDNPLWVGLAMGALAAFLGSRVLGHTDE